jgi:hypothetical protein
MKVGFGNERGVMEYLLKQVEILKNETSFMPFYNYKDIDKEVKVGNFNGKDVYSRNLFLETSDLTSQQSTKIYVEDLYDTDLENIDLKIKKIRIIDSDVENLDNFNYLDEQKAIYLDKMEKYYSSLDNKKNEEQLYIKKVTAAEVVISGQEQDLQDNLDIINDPNSSPSKVQSAEDNVDSLEVKIANKKLEIVELNTQWGIDKTQLEADIVNQYNTAKSYLPGYNEYNNLIFNTMDVTTFDNSNLDGRSLASLQCRNDGFKHVNVSFNDINGLDISYFTGGRILLIFSITYTK